MIRVSNYYLLSLVVLVWNMHAALKTMRGDTHDDCSKAILEFVYVMRNLQNTEIFMHVSL
jgi:hypothetical protein